MFSTTYPCELLLSVINFVKCKYKDLPNKYFSVTSICLKTTRQKHDVKYLLPFVQVQKFDEAASTCKNMLSFIIIHHIRLLLRDFCKSYKTWIVTIFYDRRTASVF
jgi:hypothetical protein